MNGRTARMARMPTPKIVGRLGLISTELTNTRIKTYLQADNMRALVKSNQRADNMQAS